MNTRPWSAGGAVETLVHPTAIIDHDANVAPGVSVGPYSIIGPGVVVGRGTVLGPHVFLERDTTLGEQCQIAKGAVIGSDPQDLKYEGEPSELIVGDRTVVREYATLNRGTRASGKTVVGSDCLIMAYAHVAHDCEIGNHVVISNAVNMGGHVVIEDWAIVGGPDRDPSVRSHRGAFVLWGRIQSAAGHTALPQGGRESGQTLRAQQRRIGEEGCLRGCETSLEANLPSPVSV